MPMDSGKLGFCWNLPADKLPAHRQGMYGSVEHYSGCSSPVAAFPRDEAAQRELPVFGNAGFWVAWSVGRLSHILWGGVGSSRHELVAVGSQERRARQNLLIWRCAILPAAIRKVVSSDNYRWPGDPAMDQARSGFTLAVR